jgi:hypothetical protein
MPITTDFRRGSDFRAFVQTSIAEREKPREADGAIPRALRALNGAGVKARLEAGAASLLARRPQFSLRQRLTEELATAQAAFSSLALRLLPKPKAEEPRVEPRQIALERAEAELRARRAQARRQDGEVARPTAEVARIQTAKPISSGAAPSGAASWAAKLAREYREDFHPVATAGKPEIAAPEEAPTAAASAANAAFAVGKAFWRASLFIRPVFGFLLAHSAPIIKLAAVGLAILAAAGFLAQWPQNVASPEVAEAPAPVDAKPAPRRASWVEISRPFHLYDLAAPLFVDQKFAYAARRHATGGGREDFLTFGEFAGKSPFLRLTIYRHGFEKLAEPAFFVDMARRGAAIGVSLGRADVPETTATRLGDFETAAMTLLKGRATRENCRGFRFSVAPPGLTMAGFACGAGDNPVSGGDFACLIDRLDLVSAGDDKALRDFFAAAQARGAVGCAEPSPAKRRPK